MNITLGDLSVLGVWFKIVLACAILLLIAFLAFARLAMTRESRGKGALRIVAVTALAAALGAGGFAWRAWAAYSDLMSLANLLSLPHPLVAQESYQRRAQEAVAFYTTTGWIVVSVTLLLLVAGVFVVLRSRATPLLPKAQSAHLT